MQTIQIQGVKRANFGKKGAKDIRREGMIPCVIYGNGGEAIHFAIETAEAKKLIYTPKSYIVELNIDGQIEKGVMRETQFHPVKDYCLHIDFFRVAEGKPVAIEIPVALVGYDEMVQDTAGILLLDKRIILSEDAKCLLDVQLQGIREKIDLNPEIKIVYFDEKVNKLGGGYALHSGKVKKIEEYPAMLVFLDGKKVLIEDIIQIENEK